MSNLHSQLGLSQRSMSVLLLTANVVVVAVYLLSTLAVMFTLWPALCDLGRLIFKLNAAFNALSRLFGRGFGHPAARIAAHGVVYVKSLYAVAAGSIVAPAAPLAGVLLAALGHLSATILVNANQKARYAVCGVDFSLSAACLQALPSGPWGQSTDPPFHRCLRACPRHVPYPPTVAPRTDLQCRHKVNACGADQARTLLCTSRGVQCCVPPEPARGRCRCRALCGRSIVRSTQVHT